MAIDNGISPIDKIGITIERKTSIDVGLVKLRSDAKWLQSVVGVGKITGLAKSVRVGDKAIGVGRTTGKFKATFISFASFGDSSAGAVKKLVGLDPKFLLFIQKERKPADLGGGDSGGPVLTTDHKLVGMVAASALPDKRFSIVIPIQHLLKQTDCELAQQVDLKLEQTTN